MEHILKAYRRRLINLSANNRALVLRRLSAGLQLDLQAFDFVLSQPAFALLRDLLAGKKHVPLAPLADPRQAAVAPLSRKLREISRRAALLQEERGSRELFVGWPFVAGKLNDGSVLRCPLVFFPVSLQLNEKQQWVLRQDALARPFINPSFLLAYAHYNQLPPDEDLLAFDFAGFPTEALEFRTALYELLKNSSLDLNYNQELFQDKIIPFRSFTKPELEQNFKPGELKLFPEAVLGIFPQAGSFLVADYDEMLESTPGNSLEEFFAPKSELRNPAGNLEQNTFAVFELDAPQEKVLQEVKNGASVIVQGPPGTGKSQLICNLITDFTARGKTVWVVCQKRAALDVVHRRLAEKGLGNFAALVHDFEADRRPVFEQIKRQIEETETYKKQNNQLPVIFQERRFLEISRRINQILQTLTEFKSALFDASVCGWPAKELYLRSSLNTPTVELPDFRVFTAETLAFFLTRLEQYLRSSAKFDAPEFALADRKNFAAWNWPERKKLEQLAAEIPEKIGKFFAALPAEIQEKYSAVQAWELLQTEREELEKLATFLKSSTVVVNWFQALCSGKAATVKQVAKLGKRLQRFYEKEPVRFNKTELETAGLVVNAFEKSESNWWQKAKWQLPNSAKKDLLKLLEIFQLPADENGIAALKLKLHQQQEFLTDLDQLKFYLENPFVYFSEENDERDAQFLKLQHTVKATQLVNRLVRKKWLKPDLKTVLLQVGNLLSALAEVETAAGNWHQFFTETQVQKLSDDPEFLAQFTSAVAAHFDEIVNHDRQFRDFSTAEKMVAETLQKLPGTTAEKMARFENAVYLNWLLLLETEKPVLQLAGPELDKLETELQELVLQKQALSHEIVLTRLREKTYSELEKNRLGNVVTYRKLYAQVSKKRNLFSLRKLQANFGEEIANLIPCWLASPETISAVFPLSQQPDLVIFDEASQAFAENGLPAIFRAKQVVIAGDEKQLAPTDLYRSRWQDPEEETEELFVESLLQLGSLFLPQHWLTQHYRSRFPELIHFSNRHFYQQKLQLIPERQDLENPAPAIEFIKVNGLWENQANLPEAEAVTALLFQLLTAGISDIGIITFNFTQQTLIQDVVERKAAEQGISVPYSISVKNIENMQGDEKQVIIFSVGYAADARGKVVSQFGSLSQAKGENRLNVAITRAIAKIYVVSSLWPEELPVLNAKHEGPKLLQEYLRYAQQVSAGNFAWQLNQVESGDQPFYLKNQLLPLVKTVGNWGEKLPFADLALSRGHHFCHLLRTDDELYFSQISARQTHFDVPFRLQNRNWPYTTFYSRQFWLNPRKLITEMDEIKC